MAGNNGPQFMTLVDETGRQYYSVDPTNISARTRPQNASEVGVNLATFLSDTLVVTPRVAGRFSSDLTSRDDPLLALLSLLLLLVMESILATILLRTYRGTVSNVGFSIKQFLDLAREFRFSYLFKSQRKRSSDPPRKINRNVLAVAILLLVLSFGLEGAVLFLSSPELKAVFNDKTSYTLRIDILPDWNEIQRAGVSATVRPCNAITIADVDQGNNQLSLCMTSDRVTNLREDFLPANTDTTLSIVTDVHQFGVEHTVTIGDISARFIGRGYFTLNDTRNRLLSARQSFLARANPIKLIHWQYVAYLFSQYARTTLEPRVTLDQLQSLDYKFNIQSGPTVSIIRNINGRIFRNASTVRHTTTVTGVIPRGPEALRFAHATLKGSVAVGLAGPDETDLHMGTGDIRRDKGWLWRESTRKLNWLSLSVLLAFSTVTLILLRYLFVPVGTAEIAGSYVTGVVGAEVDRPPALLQDSEKLNFRAPRSVISLEP